MRELIKNVNFKLLILASLVSALAVLGIYLLNSTPLFAESDMADADLRKREEMVTLSRHLGVTCSHCHNVKNFKNGDMTTYKVALDHMRIVGLLNKEGFRGSPKVNCYFCHRGKAKPDYIEKL